MSKNPFESIFNLNIEENTFGIKVKHLKKPFYVQEKIMLSSYFSELLSEMNSAELKDFILQFDFNKKNIDLLKKDFEIIEKYRNNENLYSSKLIFLYDNFRENLFLEKPELIKSFEENFLSETMKKITILFEKFKLNVQKPVLKY